VRGRKRPKEKRSVRRILGRRERDRERGERGIKESKR